jgi:hypothetical protein
MMGIAIAERIAKKKSLPLFGRAFLFYDRPFCEGMLMFTALKTEMEKQTVQALRFGLILHLIVVPFLLMSEVRTELHAPTTTDSLLIRKDNGKREAIIIKGQKVRIWTNDFQKFRGTFVSFTNDTLSFLVEEQLYHTNSGNIEKIKLYNNGFVRTVGVVFVAVGVASHSVSTFLWARALLDRDVTSFDPAVSVNPTVSAVGYSGAALILVGRSMSGRTVNLNTSWGIVLSD